MIHKMFCVHDVKAKAFLPPFFLHQDGMAVRVFTDCVNDPKHSWGAHPADYTLFRSGSFDDCTGKLLPEEPVSLGNGVMFVALELADDEGDLFSEGDTRLVDGEDNAQAT